MGFFYAQKKNYALAARWFLKAAENGDSSAEYLIAGHYEQGSGITKSYAKALHWYRKAAEQGDTDAMRDLAEMYDRGEGVPQDHQEKLRWYRLAAAMGDDIAMLDLGNIFERGDGVPQDYAQALMWYRRSAEKGDSLALYWVGVMYRDGIGVPADNAEAYNWFNLSASDPPAGNREDRDAVAAKLSPAELTEIQARCRKWVETHPKIQYPVKLAKEQAAKAQSSPRLNWQQGKLLSANVVVGIDQRQEWRLEIATDQYTYEATIWVTGDALNVTQGGTIAFSYTASGFYIKDDDGKLHKMTFEKKALR